MTMIYSHRFGALAIRPTLPSAAPYDSARDEGALATVTKARGHGEHRKDEAA